MNMGYRIGIAASLLSALMTGGCVTSSRQTAFAPTIEQAAPVMTPAGVEQFAVPPEGRAVIRARLLGLVGDPTAITDAKISNAWRTAEGIKQNPNDYAACVTTSTSEASRTFVIVVSGTRSSGFVGGQPAVDRCNDTSKVTSWSAFSEMIASQ